MPDPIPTRLAEAITEAMESQGFSIREIAIETGVVYEHIRRVVRGMNAPSTPLLKLICQTLHLDFEEMTKLAAADDLEKKYGDVPAMLAGKNPELSTIERYWTTLTQAQKEDLNNLARDWARRNRG